MFFIFNDLDQHEYPYFIGLHIGLGEIGEPNSIILLSHSCPRPTKVETLGLHSDFVSLQRDMEEVM